MKIDALFYNHIKFFINDFWRQPKLLEYCFLLNLPSQAEIQKHPFHNLEEEGHWRLSTAQPAPMIATFLPFLFEGTWKMRFKSPFRSRPLFLTYRSLLALRLLLPFCKPAHMVYRRPCQVFRKNIGFSIQEVSVTLCNVSDIAWNIGMLDIPIGNQRR